MVEPVYKKYSREVIVELADWEPGIKVAVHPDDAAKGHPKPGDKIRREGDQLYLVPGEYIESADYKLVGE